MTRELSVLANSLSKWVRDVRRRMETIEGTSDEQLSPAERAAFADGFRKAALARWIANHPGKTAAPAP